MTDRCERLHAYVDGELSDDEHAAFEAHLATCDACNAELPRLLAVMAALDTVAEPAARAPAGNARLTVISGGLAGDTPSPPAERPAAPRRPFQRRPWQLAAAVAGAVAIAAGLLVVLRPAGQPPAVVSLAGDLRPTRGLEPRLSYPGADRYREFDVPRGAQPREAISLDRMAELERAKNWHGLAVASLLAGERDRAVQAFAQAPATPAVESDRAALELLDGSPAALDRALADVDRALAAAPDDGAALWNHALVRVALNLPLAAARDFDRVAALHEQGWADEARRRATTLRADVARHRARWAQAKQARRLLVQDGTPVPDELLSITGSMTRTLYDAVAAAPSRARVEALLAMAQVLDAAYGSDRLTAYVRRIAAGDFAIREPFADAFRAAMKAPPTAGEADALLARLDHAHLDDLWLTAAFNTQRIADHLERFRQLAAASGDPWFASIAELETAAQELTRGDPARADRRLRDALAAARRDRLGYHALLIEDALISMHATQRNLGEAQDEAQAAFREATAAGEATMEMNELGELAAINQDRYAHRLAREYLAELLERSQTNDAVGPSPFSEANDCANRQYAYGSLANISLSQFEPARARAEIGHPAGCSVAAASQAGLTLRTALVRAELYRIDHRADDARIARDAIATMRAAPEVSPATQAMLTYVEGDLEIETDRAKGQRLLRDAIAMTEHAADEHGYLVKARAHSFVRLALDAGRASEFAQVIHVLGETLGVRPPDRCAVAIAVQDQQSVVAFAGARGETGGQFVAARRTPELDASTLVPPQLVARLAGCDRVAVLTRAPALGAGRLLPPQLAWSYVLARAPGDPAPPAAAGPRLVVANPEAPPDLKLPPLGPDPAEATEADQADATDLVVLRGPDATRPRVLQAMRGASAIELHTHGFIANDVSEASYLVLSPELDHTYKLTAADVAGIKLAAAPLVILGACHAATSSQSLEGGIGLAEAFLRSGARAVIASPDAVQDLGAREFFASVRDRVARGADPAIAVRDERVRQLAQHPVSREESWVTGVVVFQ